MDPEESFRPPASMPYGDAPPAPPYGTPPGYGAPPGHGTPPGHAPPPPPPYGAPPPSRRPGAGFGRRPGLPPLDLVEDYPRRPGRSAFWDVVRNRRTITRSRPWSIAIWVLLFAVWVASAVVFSEFSTDDGDPTNALGGVAFALFAITFLLMIWRFFRLLLRIGRRLRFRRAMRGGAPPESFTRDPFGR